MNGHRSKYYLRLPDKLVVEHFNASSQMLDNASVMVIEQICISNSKQRKHNENGCRPKRLYCLVQNHSGGCGLLLQHEHHPNSGGDYVYKAPQNYPENQGNLNLRDNKAIHQAGDLYKAKEAG